MASFEDAFESEAISLNDQVGIAGGAGHPDQDAPSGMPDGSLYLRKNGQRYILGKTTSQVWEEDVVNPTQGQAPRLKYLQQGGVQICLETTVAGLPYTTSTGSIINLPLVCV